jgi:hypothetical protein
VLLSWWVGWKFRSVWGSEWLEVWSMGKVYLVREGVHLLLELGCLLGGLVRQACIHTSDKLFRTLNRQTCIQVH